MTDVWGETSVQVKNRVRHQNQNVLKTSCRYVTSFVTVTLHTVFSTWLSVHTGVRYWLHPRIDMKKTSQKVRYEQQFGAEHEGLPCECGLFTTSATVLMLVGY